MIDYHKYWTSRFNLSLLQLRTDGEFVSTELINYCRQHGIARELTTPHTPQHNAKAERANRSPIERTRCFLFQSSVTSGYFPDTIRHACLIGNLIPRSDGVIPCKRWELPQHRLGSFPAFGCEVFAMTNVFQGKLSPRSIRSVFLGVDPERKAFRLLSVDSRKSFCSRDVKVNENMFPFKWEGISKHYTLDDPILNPGSDSSVSPTSFHPAESGGEHHPDPHTQQPDPVPRSTPAMDHNVPPPVQDPEIKPSDEVAADSAPLGVDDCKSPPPSPPSALRRSTRITRVPDRGPMVTYEAMVDFLKSEKTDEFARFASCFFTDVASPSETRPKEPSTIWEARKSAEAHEWIKAAQLELNSLEHRETWELVERPAGRKVVDNVWVFRRKLGPSGEILRHKARLCARGFSQVEGLDFDQTYSPVAAFRSLRLVFALSVKYRLKLHQLDVVAAFLNGVLDHEIFMRQPKGFDDGTGRVCLLKKAIYGLKQSSRLWNADLHKTLSDLNFKSLRSDPCLYLCRRNGSIMLLLVYVDDILIATNSEELYQDTLADLKEHYELTESLDCSWVLGWHVSLSADGIFCSQTAFTSSLLSRCGMLDANSVSTPGVPEVPASDVRQSRDAVAFTPSRFREVVGSLLFLTNCTRPDIAFAVNVACRAMSAPTPDDWMRVKRILRYLAGTLTLGIWFRKSSSPSSSSVGGNPLLFGFSDSDWAGDTVGRRSTSGFVCYVAGSPVSWSSRKQSIVALSTMEAEYVALATAAREMLSLRALLSELGLPAGNAQIFVDNSPALFVAANPVVTPRSKHIDIRYHFLRDVASKGLLHFKWIPSSQQAADIFTKFLQRELFQRCCARIVGGRDE